MRTMVKWLPLSGAILLAACGGDTGVQTVGSVAPPTGGTSPTPTPTHTFVDPTEIKTYEAIGGVQHYSYTTRYAEVFDPVSGTMVPNNGGPQDSQLYAGDANTVRDSGISVTYNPRDAIFDVTINRPLGSVSTGAMRFQDPAHRTDFANNRRPQAGVPDLTVNSVQYLESGSGTGSELGGGTYFSTAAARSNYPIGSKGYSSTSQTFFYQKPGTTTKYVTYAGFVRNSISATEQQDDPTAPLYLRETYSLDRAAFVFGERTANSAVPGTGTGTYSGEMIASAVFNPNLDIDPAFPTYFQWISGTYGATINFATGKVDSSFTSTRIGAPTLDAYTTGAFSLQTNWTFKATSTATIDMVNKGGFTGNFSDVRFLRPGLSDYVLTIAGSSIDGAFFGPNGEEVGGGFRVVGGTPDQRIDILGAFTAKK